MVTFVDNWAGAAPQLAGLGLPGQGGALYIAQTSSGNTLIKRCTLHNNHAEEGGAVHFAQGADLRIGNSIFRDNGLFYVVEPEEDAVRPDCLRGGALYIGGQTTSRMNNSIFRDNQARAAGGAIFWLPLRAPDSDPFVHSMKHCTISYNALFDPNGVNGPVGAGLHVAPGGQSTSTSTKRYEIENSILWGNLGGRDVVVEGDSAGGITGATIDIQYSNIGTRLAVDTTAPGGILFNTANCLSVDPLYVNPGTRNLRLIDGSGGGPDSPCIDAASSLLIGVDIVDIDDDLNFVEALPEDYDFAARVQPSAGPPDMGAFEIR